MKKCILFCITLSSIFASINANATLTESEKILSGFQRAPNVESLPDEIELPPVWIAALRELSKKSLETNDAGTEYGACLNVVAKGIGGGRRQSMEAYRLLLKEKANMPSDDFANKERELRRLIASDGNDGLIWNAGKIQTGDDSTILIQHGNTVCDGEVASDAHTHPETLPEVSFSLDDVLYFIKGGRTSHFVINSSFSTCFFIRTDATGSISNNFIVDITTEVKPFNWKNKYHERLAWYVQTIGIGLYCGDLRGKMKKFAPGLQSLSNISPEPYILSAKAYLSSLERLEDNPTPVSSNFRPEVDSIFLNYLTRILPVKKNYIRLDNNISNIDNLTPQEIFRYAFSFFKVGNLSPLLDINNIVCFEKNCTYADELWKNKPTRYYANFSSKTLDSYWVEGNNSTGFHRFSENPEEKTSYAGACKFLEKHCLPDGSGVLKTSDFEYQGEFRSGKMDGIGKIRKSQNNEIYQVKMKNGEIQESKRVQ